MSWIAEMIGVPHVVDEESRAILAICHQVGGGEPVDYAWSRACVMAAAPDLHNALAEMVMHAKRHFPDELQFVVTKSERELNRIKEIYDKPRR